MGEAEAVTRTERVLQPAFVEGLEDLPIEEVRTRRDDALAEREYQSYLRRLIQVRQDIVMAERERRSSGGEQQPLIDRLTSVLAEGSSRGPTRGEALPLGPSADDMEVAERRADAASNGVLRSGLQNLDDAVLDQALESLTEEERTISASRILVLRVHDRLQEELKRRYREDPSSIPTQI
jgi:anti-sigma-K factor RsiG